MDLASKNPTGGPNCDARHDAGQLAIPDSSRFSVDQILKVVEQQYRVALWKRFQEGMHPRLGALARVAAKLVQTLCCLLGQEAGEIAEDVRKLTP